MTLTQALAQILGTSRELLCACFPKHLGAQVAARATLMPAMLGFPQLNTRPGQKWAEKEAGTCCTEPLARKRSVHQGNFSKLVQTRPASSVSAPFTSHKHFEGLSELNR